MTVDSKQFGVFKLCVIMLPKPHLLNEHFRPLTSMDEGTNQFTSRALCSRIELDLWKVSQNTEYLCLFALQDNLLLALKEFKKREGEKNPPIAKVPSLWCH